MLTVQGLEHFVLKFWEKIRRSSKGSCKLNTTGYVKLAFFDQYLALFRKRYKIQPLPLMENPGVHRKM